MDIIEAMENPDALLPLPPATFHILMAVAEEDRHGYAIIQDVARRTEGALKLSAGTLYRSIQRMLEQGLLVETQERPAPNSTMSGAGITGSLNSARRWREPKHGAWRNW